MKAGWGVYHFKLWQYLQLNSDFTYGNVFIFNVLAEDFCYSACGNNRVQAVPSAINSEKAWSNI